MRLRARDLALEFGLVLLIGGGLAVGSAEALVIGMTGGTATLSTAQVTFQPLVGSPIGPYPDTLIDKNQTALVAQLTATYSSNDFQYGGGGIRWTETVLNNTGIAWTAYSVRLGGNGVYFTDLPIFSPAYVTISSGPTLNATTSVGSLVLSGDRKQIDMIFAAPLLSGQSFSFHSPVEGLTDAGPTFTITETATPVPEPTTLALLGAGLMGLRARRRRA